jgi:hypothetical protein
VTPGRLQSLSAKAHAIATGLGSRDLVELETTDANLTHAASGRNWNGPLYVATPQLLHAFGITDSQVSPTADILTMRPGLSGLAKMQLIYGSIKGPGPGPDPNAFPARRALPGQPTDPGGQRAAVRHVGAQHGDHRARHPHARPARTPASTASRAG